MYGRRRGRTVRSCRLVVPARLSSGSNLQRLERRLGRPLLWSDLDRSSYRELLRRYASIAKARAALGLKAVARPRKWSREAMKTELRQLHRAGVAITARALRDAGRHDVANAIRVYLGGFPRARRLAGIPDPPTTASGGRGEPWDADRVIDEIKERHGENLPLASSKVPPALIMAAWRHLGSWRKAIEAAGLDYEEIRLSPRYSDGQLLNELRQLARRHPRSTLQTAGGRSLASALRHRFGSVAEAARRAGVERWALRVRPLDSRDHAVRGLRARSGAGKPVHSSAVLREDMRLWESISRHFPTWEAALKRAGIETTSPRRRRWDQRSVMAELRARQKAGKAVSRNRVAREDVSLFNAARRHFGTYRAALAAIGVETAARRTWSREIIIDCLQKLARTGKVTTARAGNALTMASQRHFGGFGVAVRAAMEQMPVAPPPAVQNGRRQIGRRRGSSTQ